MGWRDQWLRACTLPPEDPSSIPSNHVRCSQLPVTLAPGASNTFALCMYLYILVCVHTHTQLRIIFENIFKMWLEGWHVAHLGRVLA